MAKKFLSNIKTDNPALNSLKSYDAAYSFSRPSGYPLDRTGFFDTFNNAKKYLTEKEAYIGQELTVFDTSTTTKAYKYFISDTNEIIKLLDERDINTFKDEKVKQTSVTSDKDYQVIITDTNSSTSDEVHRSEKLTFNPSSGKLKIKYEESEDVETLTEIGERSIKLGELKLIFDPNIQGLKFVFDTFE